MITRPQLLDKHQQLTAALSRYQFIPALLLRLYVGYFFFETGLGKVQNLALMTERFTEWGIPFPAFNAALSGYTELIGGALFTLGLGTRAVAVPLFINMVVAVVSVKLREVASLSDFVELDEPLYALAFLWVGLCGAGPLSLDTLLLRSVSRAGPPVSDTVSAHPLARC